MITRRTAKRQIAATRALLHFICTHDLGAPREGQDVGLIAALARANQATDELALETYQPQQEHEHD